MSQDLHALIEVIPQADAETGTEGSSFGGDCAIEIDGETFSCTVAGTGAPLEPGRPYTLPISFADREAARDHLYVGAEVRLRRSAAVASGTVVEVPNW